MDLESDGLGTESQHGSNTASCTILAMFLTFLGHSLFMKNVVQNVVRASTLEPTAWIGTLVLLFTHYVTLGKLEKLFIP